MEDGNKKNIPNATLTKQNKPNVPNLRFKEFTNEWEKTKLKTISEKVNRKCTEENKTIPIMMISYGNGFILQSTKYSKENAGHSLQKYTLLKKGEFSYNHGASKNKPYGVCYELIEANEARIPFVYHSFKIIKGIPRYWNYALNTNIIDKQLKKVVSSGARMDGLLNISYDTYTSINISIPSNKEQQKIADFLSLIDQRIETQSKIIEDLNLQIKWIRYKLFSNFNNLERHTLSDFLSEYYQKNDNNLYPPVAVGKYGIRKREDIYSKELAQDYSKNKIIYNNTLIIGMGSTQIDIGILIDNEIYCVSSAYTTYKIKNINPSYLNELLIFLNPLLSKRYMIISARQGKSVNKDELLAHKIFVHSNKIQIIIGKLFNKLYLKIQKEKEILSLYKKQKAYLLQNMFI